MGMEAEVPDEGSAVEHEKARIPRDRPLGIIHSGNRYAYGYGSDFYGIWDAASSGPPAEQFPATDQGRQAGWQRYVELEPSAKGTVITTVSPDEVWRREVAQSRRRGRRKTLLVLLIIVLMGVGGGLWAALGAGGTTTEASQGLSEAAKAKKAHIEITGTQAITEDLTQSDFKTTSGLIGSSVQATWKGTLVELFIDIHSPEAGKPLSTTVIPPRTVRITLIQSLGSETMIRSTNGECRVTLDGFGDQGFSGSLECSGLLLPDGSGSLEVTGTFGASE